MDGLKVGLPHKTIHFSISNEAVKSFLGYLLSCHYLFTLYEHFCNFKLIQILLSSSYNKIMKKVIEWLFKDLGYIIQYSELAILLNNLNDT